MFDIGQILEHAQMPEMGRAKVEYANGDRVQLRIHRTRGGGMKEFVLPNQGLLLSSDQSQDGFEPTRQAGKAPRVKSPRIKVSWGFEAALERFFAVFKSGFSDPKYIADERNYKADALATWQDQFGPNATWRRSRDPLAVGKAFSKVYGVIALLHPAGEWIPFGKALDASQGAIDLAEAYTEVIREGHFDEDSFNRVLKAFALIGDHKPKWTVFTYWPYVAATTGFAFIKPTLVQAAAQGMGIGLNYEPKANWLTYSQAVVLYEELWRRLEPLGAKDWVDVQTFLWVGWKQN